LALAVCNSLICFPSFTRSAYSSLSLPSHYELTFFLSASCIVPNCSTVFPLPPRILDCSFLKSSNCFLNSILRSWFGPPLIEVLEILFFKSFCERERMRSAKEGGEWEEGREREERTAFAWSASICLRNSSCSTVQTPMISY